MGDPPSLKTEDNGREHNKRSRSKGGAASPLSMDKIPTEADESDNNSDHRHRSRSRDCQSSHSPDRRWYDRNSSYGKGRERRRSSNSPGSRGSRRGGIYESRYRDRSYYDQRRSSDHHHRRNGDGHYPRRYDENGRRKYWYDQDRYKDRRSSMGNNDGDRFLPHSNQNRNSLSRDKDRVYRNSRDHHHMSYNEDDEELIVKRHRSSDNRSRSKNRDEINQLQYASVNAPPSLELCQKDDTSIKCPVLDNTSHISHMSRSGGDENNIDESYQACNNEDH